MSYLQFSSHYKYPFRGVIGIIISYCLAEPSIRIGILCLWCQCIKHLQCQYIITWINSTINRQSGRRSRRYFRFGSVPAVTQAIDIAWPVSLAFLTGGTVIIGGFLPVVGISDAFVVGWGAPVGGGAGVAWWEPFRVGGCFCGGRESSQ